MEGLWQLRAHELYKWQMVGVIISILFLLQDGFVM